MNKASSTSDWGKKPYPDWKEKQGFTLPGYRNAIISFTNINTNAREEWGFMVSPSSLAVQFSNDLQTSKTTAGWFINKGGEGLGNLTMSGYFVDSLYAPERINFLNEYRNYILDNQNNYLEYNNDYLQDIIIEGVKYSGVIQNIAMSKTGNQQFLYQYTINFIFFTFNVEYTPGSSMSVEQMKAYMGIWDESVLSQGVSTTNEVKYMAPTTSAILKDTPTGSSYTVEKKTVYIKKSEASKFFYDPSRINVVIIDDTNNNLLTDIYYKNNVASDSLPDIFYKKEW